MKNQRKKRIEFKYEIFIESSRNKKYINSDDDSIYYLHMLEQTYN